MDEMGQATDVRVRRSSTISFASGLVENFKVSSVKMFLALVHEVPPEYDRSVPDTELWLAFVKYGYLTRVYFHYTQC